MIVGIIFHPSLLKCLNCHVYHDSNDFLHHIYPDNNMWIISFYEARYLSYKYNLLPEEAPSLQIGTTLRRKYRTRNLLISQTWRHPSYPLGAGRKGVPGNSLQVGADSFYFPSMHTTWGTWAGFSYFLGQPSTQLPGASMGMFLPEAENGMSSFHREHSQAASLQRKLSSSSAKANGVQELEVGLLCCITIGQW